MIHHFCHFLQTLSRELTPSASSVLLFTAISDAMVDQLLGRWEGMVLAPPADTNDSEKTTIIC